MKKIMTALVAALASVGAYAQTNSIPVSVTNLASDAQNSITASIPIVMGVLTVGFGIVLGFWLFKLIKRAVRSAA